MRCWQAGKDEIGQLGHSFNAMADTIQIHSEQLEELVRLRTRELTEEKQTSERLLLNGLPGPMARWSPGRMESHGVPGRIQVSEATYRLLVDDYELEELPPIDIKGKGMMQTYLVIRQRQRTASARGEQAPAHS